MPVLTDVVTIDYGYMRISYVSCYLNMSLQDCIQQILKRGKLGGEKLSAKHIAALKHCTE